MERRTFLKRGGAAAAVGLVGASGAVAYKWDAIKFRAGDFLLFMPREDRIRRYFHYLDINEEGLQLFVAAHEAMFGAPPNERRDYRFFERFLLSTDFFPNGADESKEVNFVRLYDPYASACWNPCAQIGPEGT